MNEKIKSKLKKLADNYKTHDLYPDAYQRHLDTNCLVLDGKSANLFISKLLMDDKPCMIARFGSNELDAMLAIERFQKSSIPERLMEMYKYRVLNLFESPPVDRLGTNAGFFPLKKKFLERFLLIMKDAVNDLDLLGSWTKPESRYTQHLPMLPACELRFLEPYFHEVPWSKCLEGKNVLVIHPFAKLIQKQYNENRSNLFPGRQVLPKFSLNTIEAVQTLAGEKDNRFDNWFDALIWMESEAMSKQFDVAIIGCGAYGFPLAARLKRHGKKSIHLGGATQILFGIKGKRWDEKVEFSSMYNQYWVRPGDLNKPGNYEDVEGGCYW